MALMWIGMLVLMLIGIPFMVVLLAPLLTYIGIQMPELNLVMIQQIINGISPQSLICVPMFILGANIITSGKAAERLVNMFMAFFGHMPGGLAITTNVGCTAFGAVSGSSQATVAAVGGTMRGMLLKAGYPSSFTLGLIINSSNIALLIPPSICFIVYGVVTNTSVGKLFIAGILPGILICFLFSVFCVVYSLRKKVGIMPKASWSERMVSIKQGYPVMGFPLIIVGGIYTGLFSPTEAASASVLYAFFLETVLYRSLSIKKLMSILLDTGVVTAVVFILVGAGQALSWFISFLQLPQKVMPSIMGTDPSQLKVIIVIVIAYFIACMFVDPIVAVYVLSPIFAPYVTAVGLSQIFLGTLVVLQSALGGATPPFGCNIFTAQLIFRRPYFEVIRETGPFVAIMVIVTIILIIFPEIVTFLPNLSFAS